MTLGFRVAPEAPTWRHIVTTLLQITVFWSTFLWLLPSGVRRLGEAFGAPPMHVPNAAAIGATLFACASAAGFTSGMWMAVVGRGTPLPLQTARRFVAGGPYRFVRNPMALTGITQGVAVGVWWDRSEVVLYALAGALLWHFGARPPEERDLIARFGTPYLAYRRRVPLWLPRLGTPAHERLVGVALLLTAAALALLLPFAQAMPASAALLLLGLQLSQRSRAQP